MLPDVLTHHAVIDLETTGLDPERDEVIEVGVVFLDRGEVTHRLSRLFTPSQPLTLPIRRLTGLTDEALAGWGSFESYAPALQEALRGWTVVAHNAAFEQSFLSGLLKTLRSPVLDTCELFHLLYPELESHSLESLVRWAGRGQGTAHRALRDCDDTLAVLEHALQRCVDEGRGEDLADLLDVLSAPADPHGADPLVEVLRAIKAACDKRPAPFHLTSPAPFLPNQQGRLRAQGLTVRPPEGEEPPAPQPVLDRELDALLGPAGALEREVPGFRSRTEQLAVAREVARTLNEGGTLALEAGTGTGKSLAYLTPAALFASRNGRRVGVAPHTKTLQDQLVEKDLPKLHRATGGAFGFAVLKGQTNYLCRRRALEVTRVEPTMDVAERAPRAYLRAFLRRSPDGDVDRLSFWFKEKYPRLPALVQSARSEGATTLAERCPHFARCFYHSAVAQAKEADVVVVNQALALAWPQRYPPLDHLVLDEAHELEDVATTAYSAELSDASLGLLGERLVGRDGRRGLLAELRRALAGRDGGLLHELEGAVARLGGEAVDAGAAVVSLCEASAEGRGAVRYGSECRVTDALRRQPPFEALQATLLELKGAADELEKLLELRIAELLPNLSLKNPALERELSGAVAHVREVGLLTEEFAQNPLDGLCYQATVRPGGRGWQLSSQPVDVAGLFLEGFAQHKRSLVLASATLSTGAEQPWVLERLGLARRARVASAVPGASAPAVTFLRKGTPFDLPSQALVILVTDAPDPQSEAFVSWASGRISGLASFMGGRVLGLFASTRRLDEVGEQVRAALEPLGIEVLRQSRGHGRQLAARQERDVGSVLLGTKSFWQGVDIPGRGVACVFIDKLPIEPHTRPIVAAREERISQGGHLGFLRYRLPRALLQLRQGVGRLIRSEQDRGVVIIADPGHASYRGELLAALEGYRVETLPWAKARVRLHQTLLAMDLHRPRPELSDRLAPTG